MTIHHRPVRPLVRRQTGSVRLVCAAAVLGLAIGVMVHAVQKLIDQVQHVTLGTAVEHAMASPGNPPALRVALALCAAAVLITIIDYLTGRFRPVDAVNGQPVDAVEANALRGGRMSAWDGIAVVLPILLSVGSGASVGIEAAVTQIGAVVASLVGVRLGLSRPDVRVLVAAGAAAAIAGAYRAPIAGMLYAFELVLGNYAKRTLAPVGFAALLSALAAAFLSTAPSALVAPLRLTMTASDALLAVMLGAIASFVGIGVMLSVTTLEHLLRSKIDKGTTRRFLGAGFLSLLARVYPAVLGSGHAALVPTLTSGIAGPSALQLLIAKSAASATSLAAGFRGGLFSTSLLVGALSGQVFAWLLAVSPLGLALDPGLCALIAMGAVGSSVIGSPLAMTFLVVETTGSFEPIVAVAIGSVTASFLTDRFFGYSFATWRFQQRGLVLNGGQDVSRLTATPIAALIRPPKRKISAGASFEEILRMTSVAGGDAISIHIVFRHGRLTPL